MKQLPDILTSAGFWASIATLWGAAGAWGAFIAERSAAHKETEEGVRNLIAGIEAELDLVEGWASGKEGEVGYLTSAKDTELAQKYPQWYDPSFHVFTFATPTLNNFTNSPHVSLLKDIVKPIVRLNYSVRRMFDAIERHRSFAHGNPDLFLIVAKKSVRRTLVVSCPGKTLPMGN